MEFPISFSRAIASVALVALSQALFAQSTFLQVYELLQTNCAVSGCHDANSEAFDLTGTPTEVYNTIVNKTPVNAAAADRGDKLVTPGYVDRSFLLRKISHGISKPLEIDLDAEGEYMPKDTTKLPDNEIELVRQWILFGAPENGVVIDTGLINSYYAGNGVDDTYPNPEPPAPGEGFQMYVGRIFMVADTESYYFIKYDPRFESDVEIPKVVTLLPNATHHFVIYKFLSGGEANYRDGLRFNDEDSHADVSDGIGTGNNKWEYVLPQGTAYYWEAGTVLDFNLHIFNYHPDKIMSCELYINIYTQPVGTASDYMLIRNFPNFDLVVPQSNDTFTVTQVANDSTETRMWKIWQLYSHTHKFGTDYDIYVRNTDGTRGAQVYEGWYSYEDGYNVGFYRNGVEATFRYFPDDALLEVDPRVGFIHEAKWVNKNGPNPIRWGLTSAEEMMVMGFQYVKGDALTSSNEREFHSNRLNIFPNPSSGNEFTINYSLNGHGQVEMVLSGMMGGQIAVLVDEKSAPGTYSKQFSASELGIADGIYFIRANLNGNRFTDKLIVIAQ